MFFDENLSNTNSINSINSSISSLNNKVSSNTNSINSLTSKVSANTSSINTINTTLATGIGDTYSYIKVFVLNSAVTTVSAFIEDKCYGVSIVKDGLAIIPVSKKGTYTIKSYKEKQDGSYTPDLGFMTNVTITSLNSIVTVTIDNTYGENGKYGDLSFSSITDTQFANIVSALDEGKLTVNDLPWKVGDIRKVHLSAMPAKYVKESQPEQDVTFVVQNIGGVTLTNGNECHYIFGLKNCLNYTGYMDSQWEHILWENSARRKWCNEVFRNAIPETIRGCFKQFKCITANTDTTITTTDDYFALPAEKEIFDKKNMSQHVEVNALQQFSYYKLNDAGKNLGDNGGGSTYWLRSLYIEGYQIFFCNTDSDKVVSNYNLGISPFGCI